MGEGTGLEESGGDLVGAGLALWHPQAQGKRNVTLAPTGDLKTEEARLKVARERHKARAGWGCGGWRAALWKGDHEGVLGLRNAGTPRAHP